MGSTGPGSFSDYPGNVNAVKGVSGPDKRANGSVARRSGADGDGDGDGDGNGDGEGEGSTVVCGAGVLE